MILDEKFEAGIQSWNVFVDPSANAIVKYSQTYGDIRALVTEGRGVAGMVTMSKLLVGIQAGIYRVVVVACTNGHIVRGQLALSVEFLGNRCPMRALCSVKFQLTPADTTYTLDFKLTSSNAGCVRLVVDFSYNRPIAVGYLTNIAIKSVQVISL